MGGSGSGRQWYFGAKETTGDYRSLDIRRWQRENLLAPGNSFGWSWSFNGESIASINVRTGPNSVTLDYRHRRNGEAWKSENYPVYIEWTPCHFGGARPWFICPARGCGKRVAILYGGEIFACRHCYELAYKCQRENKLDRAARRANKIRDRLQWEPGILNGEGWRPKGMHRATYNRLLREYDYHAGISLAEIARFLKIDTEGLRHWGL